MAAKNKPIPSQGLFVKDASSVVAPANTGLNAAQQDGVIFPSLSRAATTYTSGDYFAADVLGIKLYIDITAVGGGPGTVIAKIQWKDPVTGNYVDSPAVTGTLNSTGTTRLSLYPGQIVNAN